MRHSPVGRKFQPLGKLNKSVIYITYNALARNYTPGLLNVNERIESYSSGSLKKSNRRSRPSTASAAA